MAVRMKDIAQALHVSIVTVSKVLNNDSSISEVTRKRILDCARQLGYRTNLAAKGLVTGQSKMVGLIVPDLVHGFFPAVAAGTSDFLLRHGYGLIISSSRGDPELERQEIQQMLARSVDAMLVATCEPGPGIFESVAREAALILLDRRVTGGVGAGYVGTDNLLAGELATQHLVDIGRRRIAHIGGPNFSPANDRERAFRSVLAREGIGIPDGYVVKFHHGDETSHTTGEQAMNVLLKQRPRPDAVFCFNDACAVGAMQAILEAGLRIPQDIAILGCGNSWYGEFLRVPLTSIDQKASQLGHAAANLALHAIQDRQKTASPAQMDVILKPTLVIRDSTSCTARARRNKRPTRQSTSYLSPDS